MDVLKMWIANVLKISKYIQVCDSDRNQRELFTCSSLEHLEKEVRTFFKVAKEDEISFCLEETGIKIRRNEHLISLTNHSRLMVLNCSKHVQQMWTKENAFVFCQGCSPKHTTLPTSNVTPQHLTAKVDVRDSAGRVCMDEGITSPGNDGRQVLQDPAEIAINGNNVGMQIGNNNRMFVNCSFKNNNDSEE